MNSMNHFQIMNSRLRKPAPAGKIGVGLLVMFAGSVLSAAPALPSTNVSGASGAFTTGHYRNLFAEVGHPEAEVTNKINAAFQQLFHGDPANQAVYYGAGANSNGPPISRTSNTTTCGPKACPTA